MIPLNSYKTKIFLAVALIFTFNQLNAQTMKPGVYTLRGIHDMAAAFRIDADGNFEFRYFYGVSDRYSKGKYTIEGDTLRFISDKAHGKDFKVKSETNDCSGYEIRIDHPNPNLRSAVHAIGVTGSNRVDADADSEGIIRFDEKHIDKIYMLHVYYPDIVTLIKDEVNLNRCFTLELLPSLEQVSFHAIDFLIKEDYITCNMNYFLPFEDIKFYWEGD